MADRPVAPRHIVRSDIVDRATGERLPLHELQHPWPEGTFIQGGRKHGAAPATPGQIADPLVHTHTRDDGSVWALVDEGVFVEAFPPPGSAGNASGGFMRAEKPAFAEAEDALWERWIAQNECPSLVASGRHRWETRGYRNGAGFCADCGVFGSGVFDLAEIGSVCVVCGVSTYWALVPREDGEPDDLVCEAHNPPNLEDIDAFFGADRYEVRPLTPAEREVAREYVGGADWMALDFRARWKAAGRIRRLCLEQTKLEYERQAKTEEPR